MQSWKYPRSYSGCWLQFIKNVHLSFAHFLLCVNPALKASQPCPHLGTAALTMCPC